jgi:dipeptidyl aminopeptidase/acylaminoacyl peptidase/tRNA A-37 threonylcarbamoyl transferase component Bud32
LSEIAQRLKVAIADRYLIERELGQGGMATVYLAHDVKHERKVALKVLQPELAAVIGAERFLNEIKVTANLQHPNILALYDSGEAGTFLYYVMPYVEGETLREKLDRERQLSVDDALQVAREIAAALQFAHERGVVHRDIKPENILFQSGQAVVADFGIALAVSQAGGARLTETGLSLGTPHYMSPEQATGDRELDARSDVYSLGAVVYEMFTGEPPHSGKSVQAIVAKILSERPSPITQTRDMVPLNVDAAVQKALAKSPADRFTSALKFSEALANPTFTLPGTAVPTGDSAPVPRAVAMSRAVPVLAFTTVVAAAAALWFALKPVEQPVNRFRYALPEGERLATDVGNRIAISPDGRRLAYVGSGESGSRIWLREFGQLNAVAVAGTDNVASLTFSPDGERIAFLRSPWELLVVDARGAPPITLVDSAISGGGVAWGADGYIYFDGGSDGIRRVAETGGFQETVVPLDTAAGEVGFAWPEVLPSGRGLLYRRRLAGQSEQEHDIMVVDFRSGETRVLLRGVAARYAASGHLLYVTGRGTLLAVPFDERGLEVTGAPTPLAEGMYVGPFGSTDVTVSGEGTLVYKPGSETGYARLVWRSRDGASETVDPNWPGDFFVGDIAVSPDGRQVALEALAPSVSVGRDVWVKQLDRGPLSRLTFDGTVRDPEWSADGRSILYVQNDADGAVYRVRADGSGTVDVVTRVGQPLAEVETDPDGGRLVVRVQGSTSRDLWVADLAGDRTAEPLLTSPFGEVSPALSPDGRWLAYVSNEGGQSQVYVRPFPDVQSGRTQVSLRGGRAPRWASDARELYYIDLTGTIMAARLQPGATFRIVEQEQLFTVQSDDYDVAPDGRFLVIEADEDATDLGEVILVQHFFGELRRTVGK